MIPLLLIFLPLVSGLLVFFIQKSAFQKAVLMICALVHALLSASIYFPNGNAGWMELKPGNLSLLSVNHISFNGTPLAFIIPLTSIIFLFVAIHTILWMPHEKDNVERHGHAIPMSDNLFIGCMLMFLGTMNIVLTADNAALLWAGMEATTLASAPLIFYHKSAESLEAMWKYILICSVGIGLALLGTMMFTIGTDSSPAMTKFNTFWIKAGFILILAGYGTKMGLSPFHAWLPDAHSEAPGNASAMLSATLLNCAFCAILFFLTQLESTPLGKFGDKLLISLGLLSLATAAFFIINQADYKRMLAYSSVEHMGLLAIMAGLHAGNAVMLHCIGHSIIKMTLFLLAGNILLAYDTRRVHVIGGMYSRLPRTAILWTIGILMICGMPPSPLFITELWLVMHANVWLAAIILILLFIVFAGMTQVCLKMCMGHEKNIPDDAGALSAEKLFWVPAISITMAIIAGMAVICCILKGVL